MYKTIIIKNETKKKDWESKIEKKANKFAKDGYSLINVSYLDPDHSVLIFQDQDSPSDHVQSNIISSNTQKDKNKNKNKNKEKSKDKNKEKGKEKNTQNKKEKGIKEKDPKDNLKKDKKGKEKSKLMKKSKDKKNDSTKHNPHDPAEDFIKPVTTGISEVAIES